MGKLRGSKYLLRQAEPEAEAIAKALSGFGSWQHFIGVPLYAEQPRYKSLLESIARLKTVDDEGRILLLLLINENPSSPDQYRHQNQLTLQELQRADSQKLGSSPPIWLHRKSKRLDVVWIDRTAHWQFPAKQGVGLARKIIADCGLSLWAADLIQSQWIHNTDADAHLPEDYLLQAAQHESDQATSALIYQYRHIPPQGFNSDRQVNDHWQAAQRYEAWLRYYELGLDYAGSAFAVPTIGSTITIHARSYEKVHGFPRRSAGEDFYLINKLAKQGGIQILGGAPITLTDRPSDRVPFGTGQGTAKIEGLQQSGQEFLVYHPLVFDGLRLVLRAARQCIEAAPDQFLEFAKLEIEKSGLHFKDKLFEAMKNFGIANACVIASKQGRDELSRIRQFHVWFDAFRTLKWVHLLRDQIFGNLALEEALDQAAFIPKEGDRPHPTLTCLRRLQDKTRRRGLYAEFIKRPGYSPLD